MKSRAFTAKSLIFGLIGVLIVCLFPHYGGKILGIKASVEGYLPILPVFLVVLLSLGWNLLAGKLNGKLALNAKELSVVCGMMLMVAWIPATQHAMVRQLVLPRYEEMTTNASWQEAGVTVRMPDKLFPRGENGEAVGEKTHFGMIQGGLPADQVPYRAWIGPLLAWMPLLVVLSVGLMALTFVVHRQWTAHEQLRYPLVSVLDALIRQDKGRRAGAIFSNRLFWCGFAFVFGFCLLQYLNVWFPTNVPKVPNEYGLNWAKLFPSLRASNANMFLLGWMPISFALLGIAFLVPTDVSLSVGLTAPLGTLVAIQYYLITGDPVSSGDLNIFRAGGFIAFGIILAYTGRSYYFPVLMKAIWPGRKGAEVDPGGVWAARVFLVAYVSLILIVASVGVDLLIAWMIVTFVLLIFLVVTRLVCETGIPLVSAQWSLPKIIVGLLGPAAVGSAPLMFIAFLSSVIVSQNSTSLMMPYMATSLKLVDDNGVNRIRFAAIAKIAILIALVAGFGAIITFAYTEGEGNLSNAERGVWGSSVREVLSMMDLGQYKASEAAHGFAKLGLFRPDGQAIGLIFAGLSAVILCYLLRFRFSKWPLHPLFFVIIGAGFSTKTWSCFLLGWVLKTLVVKIGGARSYKAAMPLFIGFIMGDFMLKAVTMVVRWIYFAFAGVHTPGYG